MRGTKLDHDKVKKLSAQGVEAKHIAERLGCAYISVKQILGEYPSVVRRLNRTEAASERRIAEAEYHRECAEGR